MDLPQLTTRHHNVARSLVMWVEPLGCVRCFPGSATNKPGLLSNARVADHSPKNTFPKALGTRRCPSPGSPSCEDAGGTIFWRNHTWGTGPLHPHLPSLSGMELLQVMEGKQNPSQPSAVWSVSLRSDGSSPASSHRCTPCASSRQRRARAVRREKGSQSGRVSRQGRGKIATTFLNRLARFLLEKPLQRRPWSLRDPLGHSTTCWQRDGSGVRDGTRGERTALAVCFSRIRAGIMSAK